MEQRPLEGVRIVALEQLMALPFGTQLLSDFGADVICVEPMSDRHDALAWRIRTGRHKRRIKVDLSTDRGRELVRRLAATADVFAENYRPGVLDRYGLGYAALSETNPRLVYLSVSGYGHEDFLASPYASLASYGPVGEAMGGITHALLSSGTTGFFPGALGDIISSIYGVAGVLVALHHRDRTGRGQYVDVAMADSLFTIAERPFAAHTLKLDLAQGTDADPAGDRIDGVYVGGYFPAADGLFLLLVLNEHHWHALCRFLGHEEWVAAVEGASADARHQHAQEVVAPALAEWAAFLTRQEASTKLREQGLAAAPVLGPEDQLVEPHFVARQMIQQVLTPDGKPVRMVGNPIKLSDVHRPETATKHEPARIAAPGEHTRQVVMDLLGLPETELDDLLASGVVAEA